MIVLVSYYRIIKYRLSNQAPALIIFLSDTKYLTQNP